MIEYDRAMTQVELALRRTAAKLRRGGETCIEDALWLVADEIASLAEEARRNARPEADQ